MARPKSEDKRKAILDDATAYLRSAVLPLPVGDIETGWHRRGYSVYVLQHER